MRPTTASASKTHEKVVTPPKAMAVSRPVTRNGHAHKMESHGSPVAHRGAKVKIAAAKDEEQEKSELEKEKPNAEAAVLDQSEPAQPEAEVSKSEPVQPSKEESAAVEPETADAEIVEQKSTEEIPAPAANVAELSPPVIDTENEEILGEAPTLSESEPVPNDKVDVSAIMEEDEKIENAAEKGELPEVTASAESEKIIEEQAEPDADITSATETTDMAAEPVEQPVASKQADFEVPIEEGISEACLASVGKSDKPHDTVKTEDKIEDVETIALAS
jgi:hypothetical protein